MSTKNAPDTCFYTLASGAKCKNKVVEGSGACRLPSHAKAWADQQAAEKAAADKAKDEEGGKDKGKRKRAPAPKPPAPDAIAALPAVVPVKPADPAVALDDFFGVRDPEAPKPPEPPLAKKPEVADDDPLPVSWQARFRNWLDQYRMLVVIGTIAAIVIGGLIWRPWSSSDTTAPASETAAVEEKEGETKVPPPKPEAPAAKTTELGVRWDTCPAAAAADVTTLGKLRNDVSVSVVDGTLYVFHKSASEWGKHIAQIPVNGCKAGDEVWKDVSIPR